MEVGQKFWVSGLLCVPVPSVLKEAVWSGDDENLGSGRMVLVSSLRQANPFSFQPSGFLSIKFSSVKWEQ